MVEASVDPAGVDIFSVERRRRRDLGFLAVLGALLLTSLLAVVRGVYPPRPTGAVSAGGEIRPVDRGVLRRQLRSGRLSNHPAEHWRPAPARGEDGR